MEEAIKLTPGIRIKLRGEDFLVTKTEKAIIDAEGVSELVEGQRFKFDLRLEDYNVISPDNTELQPDTSPNYRQTKLFLETVFRNSSHYSDSIEIAHKAAIRGANYQYVPTLKALSLPRPRILIADAVGLGKTVQVGIFMAELIRRGKGKKILVVTPKSILAQFQQEIWSRFTIPLVRLDSQGIARIKADLPSNKNPFDYYDKVIVSIDTLKNNAKFRHYLEKVHWDIVAIDECHTVANVRSQRGSLAKFLSERTEAMALASATPHNGKQENFTNLISLLDPTAIPYNGDFTKEDIAPLYVRRFKKDIENEVGDAFKDRITQKITCPLTTEEENVLAAIQDFKKRAYEESEGDMGYGTLLFSIGLFKAYMSSPKACLETINRRLEKGRDDEAVHELLEELRDDIRPIVAKHSDAKYNKLLDKLRKMKWSGKKKDDRIIIFAERRDSLNELEKNLKKEFDLSDDAVIQFNGSLTDTQQQEILEDFSKEDSKIRLFLASDAGSQGVNLHYHCHIMFNYDIPWSIITLDQRNGRIDRFGQNNVPLIYYLIAESKRDDVQGDIRILERLKEKEEEVHKNLGDAGSVWKLFDEDQEEKKVAEAIARSDSSVLETSEEQETDWLDMFGLGENETKVDEQKIEKQEGFDSFYEDEFRYYSSLVDELVAGDEKLRGILLKDEIDEVLEISQSGKELTADGVLYDIPREAFPSKGITFKLTTNQEMVEQAIILSRKKQREWPSHQLLYDLNPIAQWMQHKLLAQVDRGNALVARLRNPLQPQSAWFVFQGITSNGQGRPIFSKSFVVGKSFSGGSVGNLESFSEFQNQYRLKDSLPDLEIPQKHLESLQDLIPKAVESARNLYSFTLQGNLEQEMEDKLNQYEQKLKNWLQDSERQLEMSFGGEEQGAISFHKNNGKKELKYVNDQMMKFYEEYFQLENEPFIRLLAVFYNADN